MPREKEIKITHTELLSLIPPDKLQLIETTVWRTHCRQQTIITEYKNTIYRDDLDDTILRGKCIRCGGAVGRYIETGDEQTQT